MLFAGTAHAEFRGVSLFAINSYSHKQCSIALTGFKGIERPMVAMLWKTFDSRRNWQCLKRFIKSQAEKEHAVEIHFSNEAGRNNRRLAAYEFLPHLTTNEYNAALARRRGPTIKAIKRQARQISRLMAAEGSELTTWFVSTGLEDSFSDSAYRQIAITLKNELPPETFLVRSPRRTHEKRIDRTYVDIIELHGSSPKYTTTSYCISNNDGTDIDFTGRAGALDSRIQAAQVPTYIRRARNNNCNILLWWSGPQGITSRFRYPRDRTFVLDPENFNFINHLLRGDL